MGGPAWLTERPIAHRGFHDRSAGCIENTLTAVEAAIARDFAIECDVQITSDGEAIVFHDENLMRLTGVNARVDHATLSTIQGLHVLGTSDRIPTLTQLLDAIAGRAPLFVEIKSRFDGDKRLAERVADVLARHAGPVAAMSFDADVIRTVRRRAPSVPCGLVASLSGRRGARCHPHRKGRYRDLSFVAYEVGALRAEAHRPGEPLPRLAWTVRTIPDRLAARRHADQIIFEGFDPSSLDTGSAAPA
ncbi:glycerophosphodiester phosphodiesterase family protein [Bauldia sp.]|uniref:glycerophosphodiester phosphodiesterase family protein n=1 Tax=Bauldia sp. TaxID=2575872 RepID=UPI003BAD2853